MILFDVDGTLCPFGKPIQWDFWRWAKGREVALIGGGTVESIRQKVPKFDGMIFGCLGNEGPDYINAWPEKSMSGRKFYPTWDGWPLLMVGETGSDDDWRLNMESRHCMFNFRFETMQGDLLERSVEWRAIICTAIETLFPPLRATVGGRYSIDVTPKGYGKEQVVPYLLKRGFKIEAFYGDRMRSWGNDHDLAFEVYKAGGKNVAVASWKHTHDLLLGIVQHANEQAEVRRD